MVNLFLTREEQKYFDHLLEFHTWEHHMGLYINCANIQASLDYIKRPSLSCGRSISFLMDISVLPIPTSFFLPHCSEESHCWLIPVISEEFFCPLTIQSNYSPWKQRRETPIYFCIPPSFHYLSQLPPAENKHPPPPPCLIVHIVIGDISINLVICSRECLLCFPSSICSFL